MISDADQWCSVVLPSFAKHLLAANVEHVTSQANMDSLHQQQLQHMRECSFSVAFTDATEKDRAARAARAAEWDDQMEEKDNQIQELQMQLAVAEGKVQLLQGLLGQQLGGQ